jgi:Zn finger protein HypA/HybF involved in hydrogenase expression
MRCDQCKRHPDVDEEAVRCPLCGKQSLVSAGNVVEAIVAWNAMVDG